MENSKTKELAKKKWDELQAKVDEANEKGRLESLKQYDLGYKKGQDDIKDQLQDKINSVENNLKEKYRGLFNQEMTKVVRILNDKYPDAVNYIYEKYGKSVQN